MLWDELVESVSQGTPNVLPDIVLIHLGGNDLPQCGGQGGSVILYPDIRVSCPELYREDGLHLSDLGLDLFLPDLQGGLRAEIFSLVEALGHTV